MLGDLLAIILTLTAVPLAGIATGEAIMRLANRHERKVIREVEAEEKREALRQKAFADARDTNLTPLLTKRTPTYVIHNGEGEAVYSTHDAAEALRHFTGLLDHTMTKYTPGEGTRLVGRNRSMKTEKKAV